MQTTSALWKRLWASGNARLEAVAVIAGTTYTEITAPVINRAVMQNGLSIGNAVSATCRFTVRTTNTIPKSAQVQIKMRLTDGTQTSEWLPAGTFYVSHRTRDAVTGLITLECYDALLKANADAVFVAALVTADGTPIMTSGGEPLCYAATALPISMQAAAQYIAEEIGVTIDPSTTLKTGADYIIQAVENGLTIHDMLAKIAAANGGNWIMTPYNTLKLVPVVSSAGAAEATENVVDVGGIIGGIQTSRTGTISGIRYTVDGAENLVGDESGIVIQADVTAAVAADLAGDMIGMTYQSYSLTGAVYDPAAELGDYVRAGANGEVQALLCSEVANLGIAYRGDLSAPELGELADEYPYIGTAKKTLDLAMGYADNAAAAAAQTLDNTLTQQEIFDRLTDGGLTQGIALEAPYRSLGAAGEKLIYLNLDYARFGKLVADFIQGGTLTLGGLNNENGLLQIVDQIGTVIGEWNNNGININNGDISIIGAEQYGQHTEIHLQSDQYYPMYISKVISAGIAGTKTTYLTGESIVLRAGDQTQNPQLTISPTKIMITNQDAIPGRTLYAMLEVTNDGSGPYGNLKVNGKANIVGKMNATTYAVNGTDGASGTFTTADNKTVTVTNGIITSIV